MEEVFAVEDEFPLAIFVVFGDGIESIVDSSLLGLGMNPEMPQKMADLFDEHRKNPEIY